MADEMNKLGAKAMGKARAASKLMKGQTGILRHLAAEHGEVASLMRTIVAKFDEGERHRELFHEIRTNLLAHARAEENVFYPLLRGQPSLAIMVERALQEHREIERLVEQLSTTSMDTEAWRTMFERLQGVVERHVDYEEGDLFDRVKDLFDGQQRREILEEYETAEQTEKQRLAAV